MASLAFALTGPPAGALAPSAILASPGTHGVPGQPAKWDGVSTTKIAALSAMGAAVVGRAMTKTSRKKRSGRAELHAFDPSKQVGAMEPFGYWDPLSIMKEGFKNPAGATKSEETFNWYRAAEIKHGRISMMAILGLVAGESYKWPGFEDVPGGWAALDTSLGGAGFGMIFLIAGMCELGRFKQDPSREPGNFGDPLGWTRMDGNAGDFWTYSRDMRNKELAHCRLAMSGVITCFLLEYGGYDSSIQFGPAGPVPGWVKFCIPVLAGLWLSVRTGNQFYVADDAGASRPAYLGAAPSMPALGAAAAAPAAAAAVAAAPAAAAPAAAGGSSKGSILEKSDGRFRFKEGGSSEGSSGASVVEKGADGKFKFKA